MLTSFNNNRFNTSLVKSLIVILTCLWFGGIVQHYCLDGMEPDVSVHFENFNGHVEHSEESGHIDFETQALTDNLLPKSYAFGIQMFSLFLLIITQLKPTLGRRYLQLQSLIVFSPNTIRPPLRAPPVYS